MPDETNKPQILGRKELNFKNVLVGAVVGLVLVVAASLGFLYFLNQKSSNSDTGTSTTTKSASKSASKAATQKTTPTPKVDETAGWQTYKNTVVPFTIKYPSGWVTENIATQAVCSNDQVFFAPSKDLLGRCASGFGGLISVSRTDGPAQTAADSFTAADYTDLVKANITVAGKATIKVTGVSKISNEMGDFTGMKVIYYIIDLGAGKILMANYTQSKTWADYSHQFELMIGTLTIG